MKKPNLYFIYRCSGFLKFTLTLCALLFLSGFNLKAQVENLRVIWLPHYQQWLSFSDSRNSLYNHLIDESRLLLEKRNYEINQINSLPQWQQRQKAVKELLQEIAGPFSEKTPLNAKITRVIDKDSFRVEHIVFESQPGLYVTSSLFIPSFQGKKGKAPAIIYCSGHTDNAYRAKGYQHVILNLVKKGFIVFAFDPSGQGERLQYLDPATGESIFEGGPTHEHSYPGAQAFISGSSQARFFIWDGIRAVDYLLTRKEVDPARIGITGQSGGGTQSAIIAALDDRIYATAPQCFITSYNRIIQSMGPGDAEQVIFNGIARGLEHADLLAVRAPKPALLLTTTEDFFSIQGVRETSDEVSRIYKAYGKEENFGRVEDGGRHGYTKKTREAMYAFFQKHFNTPGSSADETVNTLTDEEMRITPTGQVSTSLGGETVFSRNRIETEKIAEALQNSRMDLTNHLPGVVVSAKKLSGYREPSEVKEHVFTGQVKREGYVIEKYFIDGDGDYIIPYLLWKPEKSNNKALIYLHPSGKAAESAAGGEIEWFVKNGFTVLAPDLLGLGEMGPGDYTQGDSNFEGISFNIWFVSVLNGRSIAGIRAGDVVKLARLLRKETGLNEIYGFARKEMSPVMLHAAAFDNSYTRIALLEPFTSYLSIVNNRFYRPQFIYNSVPGALKHYDLPDLAACLAPMKLVMAGVTDGNGKVTDTESINKDLEIIKRAYRSKSSERQLNIVTGENQDKSKLYEIYTEWIK